MRLFGINRGGFLGLERWAVNGFADSIDERILKDVGKHNIQASRSRYEQTRAHQVRGDRQFFGSDYSNFAYIPAEQYAIRDIQSQRLYVNQRADGQNTAAGQKLMATIYKQVATLYQNMASVQASYEDGL